MNRAQTLAIVAAILHCGAWSEADLLESISDADRILTAAEEHESQRFAALSKVARQVHAEADEATDEPSAP